MAVFAGEDHRPAWPANAIGTKRILKQYSFLGDPVNVRRVVDLGSVGANGMTGMIIREDKNDVGSLGNLGLEEGDEKQAKDKCKDQAHGEAPHEKGDRVAFPFPRE